MADNVQITAGSGTAIKTDDLGAGGHVQYVKLMDGTDNGSGVIPGDASNGLDVDITRIAAGTNVIGGMLDAGPVQTLTQTYTASANMTTAAAITAAPAAGKKIALVDVLISADRALDFDLEMETSGNVLAKIFLPAKGSAQITMRGYLRGDVADKKIFGKASAAGNVAITAVYFSE